MAIHILVLVITVTKKLSPTFERLKTFVNAHFLCQEKIQKACFMIIEILYSHKGKDNMKIAIRLF